MALEAGTRLTAPAYWPGLPQAQGSESQLQRLWNKQVSVSSTGVGDLGVMTPWIRSREVQHELVHDTLVHMQLSMEYKVQSTLHGVRTFEEKPA